MVSFLLPVLIFPPNSALSCVLPFLLLTLGVYCATLLSQVEVQLAWVLGGGPGDGLWVLLFAPVLPLLEISLRVLVSLHPMDFGKLGFCFHLVQSVFNFLGTRSLSDAQEPLG